MMIDIPIVKAILDVYNKQYRSFGDYSVTELISPPREVQLRKRYGHELVPDPRSVIAALIGTSVHEYIEHMLRLSNLLYPQWELERSVFESFELEDGSRRLVTGKFDVLREGRHLHDNKVVNVWKKIFDPDMKDWHEQQNLYAYLLHVRGIDVETINITAWYKDWKEADAIRDRNYPQDQVVEYQLTLWPWDYTEDFLYNKLAMHVAAEKQSDAELPVCTREERWERHPGGEEILFALMKNSVAKRASKVCKTMDEAIAEAQKWPTRTGDSYIEVRFAVPKKCVKYCRVASKCNWFQQYQERLSHDAINDIIYLKDVM